MVSSMVLKLLVLASACFLAVSGQYYQNPCRKVVNNGHEEHGGKGGDYFNDYRGRDDDLYLKIVGVRSIIISYSDQVESIQVTYLLSNKSLYQTPRHGSVKNINPPVNIKLANGEYVQKIEGKTNGVLVDQLTITTFRPKDLVTKKYGPFGKTGETYFSYDGYIIGFFGRSGDMLDSIGVYRYLPAKKSVLFGSAISPPEFDENPDTGYFPPVARINKLFIHHGAIVYSIQARYQLLGGASRLGEKFKGILSGDITTTVKFEDDEEILGIEGTSVPGKICQLTFISRRYNISNPQLYNGPYGWPCQGSTPFSVSGNVLGFFGYSTYGINGLGVYYS